MANVRNIDQIIMIGRDDDGNEVLFNFKGINNCALVTQGFSTTGDPCYDVEFHATEHWITYEGEELYPVDGMYARETKKSAAELQVKEDSLFSKDYGLKEISW